MLSAHILFLSIILIILFGLLKHKDSFGKSKNLSKIFFAETLVFDHDYEGKCIETVYVVCSRISYAIFLK